MLGRHAQDSQQCMYTICLASMEPAEPLQSWRWGKCPQNAKSWPKPKTIGLRSVPALQFSYTQTVFSTAVINLLLARCETEHGVGNKICTLTVPLAGADLNLPLSFRLMLKAG